MQPTQFVHGMSTTLDFAATYEAESVTIDTDMGEVTVTPKEAQEMWDSLAPGEGFEVMSISFAEQE